MIISSKRQENIIYHNVWESFVSNQIPRVWCQIIYLHLFDAVVCPLNKINKLNKIAGYASVIIFILISHLQESKSSYGNSWKIIYHDHSEQFNIWQKSRFSPTNFSIHGPIRGYSSPHRPSHCTGCTDPDPTNFWESDPPKIVLQSINSLTTWTLPTFQPQRCSRFPLNMVANDKQICR